MDRELIISEIVFLKVQIKYARTYTYIDTRRVVSILSIRIQVPMNRIGFLCGDIENTLTHTHNQFSMCTIFIWPSKKFIRSWKKKDRGAKWRKEQGEKTEEELLSICDPNEIQLEIIFEMKEKEKINPYT